MLSEKLDPQVKRLLEQVAAEGGPALESLPPEEARRLAATRRFSGQPESVAAVQDRLIPGPAGNIRVRIYTPEVQAPRPGLVYFHGGGWVVCDLDTHDVACRAIARRAGAALVAVDYRLAPEHKFPAAVEDCYAATAWVAENADELGIDRERLSVGGDSAGGNLATVVSLRSRNADWPKIALQVLVYPVVDLLSFDTASYREFANEHWLTRSQMEWFRTHYLDRQEDAVDPEASPLRTPDLRGLPPALILTAECDPLCDDGDAYANRLRSAGVPVACKRFPGLIHPFFTMAGAIPQAYDAYALVADAVRLGGIKLEL